MLSNNAKEVVKWAIWPAVPPGTKIVSYLLAVGHADKIDSVTYQLLVHSNPSVARQPA